MLEALEVRNRVSRDIKERLKEGSNEKCRGE
jgi:hypothetical protein